MHVGENKVLTRSWSSRACTSALRYIALYLEPIADCQECRCVSHPAGGAGGRPLPAGPRDHVQEGGGGGAVPVAVRAAAAAGREAHPPAGACAAHQCCAVISSVAL